MPSLLFQPTTSGPFAVGDTIRFSVVGEDLPGLSAVFFDLTYDASLLSYRGAEFDSRLDFVIPREEPDDASGEVTIEDIQAGSFSDDPSGDFTIVTLTFEVQADGSASVAIAPRSAGGEFLIDSEGNGIALGAPEAASIDIGDVSNAAPVAGDDGRAGFGTGEDTAFTTASVLANDTDEDGDALTVTAFDASGTLGLVTDNGDGTFDYEPNGAFENLGVGDSATDSFAYTVFDGNGGTDTATVTVTIEGANDDPAAGDDSDATGEDAPVDIDVLGNDTDVDGDALTVSAVGAAANGTTAINADGTIRYTPSTGFAGADSFSYTVSDGNGGTDTATVTVDVSPTPNQPPVAAAISVAFGEDEVGRTVALLDPTFVSDPDGDDLDVENVAVTAADGRVLSATTDPETGLFSLDDGQFEDLAAGASLTATIDYDVSDGLTTVANTATVTITGINDAPVAADDDAVTNAAETVSIDVLANDTDADAGDMLAVTDLDTTGTMGIVTYLGGGTFDYDPGTAFEGLEPGETASDAFAYAVADDQGASDAATVTITVTGGDIVIGPIIVGTEGNDRLAGTGAGEIIRSLGGRLDVIRGGGGEDVFDFSDATANGVRETRIVADFEAGEALDLGTASIADSRALGNDLLLVLDGDGDAIRLAGVTDLSDVAFV